MKKSALITGASSGIGYELSKVFAKNGYDLILVSRNVEKLKSISEELKNQYDIEATVIKEDLSRPTSPQELYQEVTASGIKIDVLVNNAGMATHGKFIDSSADSQANLIQLNVTSLTMLCRLFGADMAKNGSGKILNIASTAAFQAGPLMSTYYASKAYVLLLSEALKTELKKDNITVTALCPGPTQTDFFKQNDLTGTNLERSPYMMSAARVAEIGFNSLIKGKTFVIPGFTNKLLAFAGRLAPRAIPAAIAASLNKK